MLLSKLLLEHASHPSRPLTRHQRPLPMLVQALSSIALALQLQQHIAKPTTRPAQSHKGLKDEEFRPRLCIVKAFPIVLEGCGSHVKVMCHMYKGPS